MVIGGISVVSVIKHHWGGWVAREYYLTQYMICSVFIHIHIICSIPNNTNLSIFDLNS